MTNDKKEELTPFIQWVGGKRQLLPEITKHLPPNLNLEKTLFIEPFVGGGAVFLNYQPKNLWINDINEELINTYLTIKNNLTELKKELDIMQQKNNKEDFIKIRSWDREENWKNKYSPTQRASRFIYLNKTGFNALYRVNSKNQNNVSYGKNPNANLYNNNNLKNIHNYLNNPENNIKITNESFEKIITNAPSHSFIYLDPPYASEDNKGFVAYDMNKFNNNIQQTLKNLLTEANKKDIQWLYSNANVSLIHELFKEYQNNIDIINVRRNISSKVSTRGYITELMITNYSIH